MITPFVRLFDDLSILELFLFYNINTYVLNVETIFVRYIKFYFNSNLLKERFSLNKHEYSQQKRVAFATPFSFSYSSIILIPLRPFSTGVIKS